MAAQREWFEKDYYQVLGCPSTATDKEITKAYRKLAKQYHPDANPGSEERFKEISAAYDVLGDPAKRKEYDEVRRLGPMAGGLRRARRLRRRWRVDLPRRGHRRPRRPLRRAVRRPRRPAPAPGPQRGADIETELHLSFEDAVRGVTATVNVPDGRALPHLQRHGRGAGHLAARPATGAAGAASLDDNQGLFSLSHDLPEVQRPGHARRDTVPDVPRHRDRAAEPPGEGARPGRGGGRPADPGEGTGRARPGHGAPPATSTWWSTWASTRSSVAAGATSP